MDAKFRPAIDAVMAGDIDRLRELLREDPSLATARSSVSHPTLLQCLVLDAGAAPNKIEMANVLVDAGAEIDKPLMACGSADSAADVAELLLDRGGKLNGIGNWSPLEEALYWNNARMIELFVRRGASIHNLRIAAGLGRTDLVAGFFNADGTLKESAGKVDWPWFDRHPFSDDPQNVIDNAFVYACMRGHIDTAKLLLERGAKINSIPGGFDFAGTGLHYAALNGQREMVEFLAARGADAKIRDTKVGATPAGWAEHSGHHELKQYLLSLVLLLLFSLSAFGQSQTDPLPRRGYFGVALEKVAAGVRITSVTPGSTAADSKIAVGDILTSIDDKAADTTDAALAAMGRHKGGDSVKIGLVRDGERRDLQTTLKNYPVEQMANATMSYGSVVSLPGVRLRTIVSVPTTSQKQFPAVLLIQGGGCGSIDTPFSPLTAQPGLMHFLGSRGFVTMRVEKSGIGDSQGPSCASIGYKEELAGYQAALKALRSNPAVDRKRIYLLGVSLGGVFAPILAAETKVAGISVWGSPDGPTPAYPGRSDRFFKEFAKVDVAGAWAKVGTRVQVLHGEYDSDDVVNRQTSQHIAEMVNRAKPGSAQFRELPGLDHCWSRQASLEASKDRCGQGEEQNTLADTILAFLRETGRQD